MGSFIKHKSLNIVDPMRQRNVSTQSPSIPCVQTSQNMQTILDKLECIQPKLNKSKSLKLININAHKQIQIIGKYIDKMPQSPHLNPPQEQGYNNDDDIDDSMDDDIEIIDDDMREQSLSLDDAMTHIPQSPSLLDLSAPGVR